MPASDGAVAAAARGTPPGRASGLTPEEARLQRSMKLVVVGLAVLLFAGLAAVAGRVIYLSSSSSSSPSPRAEATRQAGAPDAAAAVQALDLPEGAHVRSVSLSGDRLAVHYDVGAGQGIAVVDLATGRTISNLIVAPKR